MNKLTKIIVVASSYIFAMCPEDILQPDPCKVKEQYELAVTQDFLANKQNNTANTQYNRQKFFTETDSSVLIIAVCDYNNVKRSLEDLVKS